MNTQAQAVTFAPATNNVAENAAVAPAAAAVPSPTLIARLARWLRDDPQEAREAYLAAATGHVDLEQRAHAWDAHVQRQSSLTEPL